VRGVVAAGKYLDGAIRNNETLVRLARLLPNGGTTFSRGGNMLWTIVIILLVLWALGFAVHIGGGLIHLLLVIAIIVVLVRVIQGRRPV
jgi:hypothetical protein